jgi:hypothetical protein
MGESADFDDAGAIAVSIGSTSLVGTGLAKESGGNLDTHTRLLGGSQAGALVGTAGNTVALETAALIAGGVTTAAPGGAPLLHGVRQVYSSGSQVIAQSGTFNTGVITFTRPGYLFRILAQMSGTNAVQPTVLCDLTWKVGGVSGPATAEEQWYVPAAGSSQKRTTGRGPTKGDTLQIAFTNGDANDTVTITVNVYETTQHMARDDWRSDGAIASSGASAISQQISANNLGNDSFTVPASTSVLRNLPLYAGQANIWINQNTGAGSQIQVLPASIFAPSALNPIASLDWTAAPHQLIGVVFPRAWCQLLIVNQAAAQVTFTVGITALEFAS